MEQKTGAIRTEENDKALKAWCNWHGKCWVDACDESDRVILRREIIRAYHRKLYGIGVADMLGVNDSGKVNSFDDDECIMAFDYGLIEMSEPGDKTRKKAFKDYVWLCANESSDPPLKVIRGKLVGNRGVINGIVEKHLKERGFAIYSKTGKDGKRKDIIYAPSQYREDQVSGAGRTCSSEDDDEEAIKQEILDVPGLSPVASILGQRQVGGEVDQATDIDSSVELETVDSLSPGNNEIETWLKQLDLESKIKEGFDWKDAAIFIALTNDLKPTTDKELLAFTKLGKSMIAKRRNNYAVALTRILGEDVVSDDEVLAFAFARAIEVSKGIVREIDGGEEFIAYAEEKYRTAQDAKMEKRLGKMGEYSAPLPGFEGHLVFSDNSGNI